MEFQIEQVGYFLALGFLVAVAVASNNNGIRGLIAIIVLIAFFVNPFRTVQPPMTQVMGEPQFSVPAKVEGKEYVDFDTWNQEQKSNLNQSNKDNHNEINK